MNQSSTNPEPSPPPAAPPQPFQAEGYRAGLERAMSLVWTEKQKLSVVTPAYFALTKLWDELYLEANPKKDGAH